MSLEIERVVPRFVARTHPTARLLQHARCVPALSDVDAMQAQVEVHAAMAGAGLQVATRGSDWMFVAAGAPCMAETVTESIRMLGGDVLLLPAGTAALLLGDEWLALRFRRVRLPRLQHLPGSWLARHAIRLADMLRSPDASFALVQRGRMVTRLLRELEHVRREAVSGEKALAR